MSAMNTHGLGTPTGHQNIYKIPSRWRDVISRRGRRRGVSPCRGMAEQARVGKSRGASIPCENRAATVSSQCPVQPWLFKTASNSMALRDAPSLCFDDAVPTPPRKQAAERKAAKLRSWCVSLLRQRAHYLSTVRGAPDERFGRSRRRRGRRPVVRKRE